MTESKAEKVPETAKELLALNPKQESEFKQKVQQAKKNKSKKVGTGEAFELDIFLQKTSPLSYSPIRRLQLTQSLTIFNIFSLRIK